MDWGADVYAARMEEQTRRAIHAWEMHANELKAENQRLRENNAKLEHALEDWKKYGRGKARDLGIAIADAATGNMEAVALRRYLKTVRETLEKKLPPDQLKQIKDMLSIRNPEFAQALYANLKDRENTPGDYTGINTKNALRDKDVYEGYTHNQEKLLEARRWMIPVFDENKATNEHDPGVEFSADNAFKDISKQPNIISQ